MSYLAVLFHTEQSIELTVKHVWLFCLVKLTYWICHWLSGNCLRPRNSWQNPYKLLYYYNSSARNLQTWLIIKGVSFSSPVFGVNITDTQQVTNKHVLSFFSALQANAWCPHLRTTCHADLPSSPKMMSCCARVATLTQRSWWKSSRVWNVSRTLPKWWRMRSSISGWPLKQGTDAYWKL